MFLYKSIAPEDVTAVVVTVFTCHLQIQPELCIFSEQIVCLGHCKDDCNIISHNDSFATMKMMFYCNERMSLDKEFAFALS
jgi:(2Fe-2S) ferredoxin